MPSVFGKLNVKDQKEILVLNAPASFEPELATLEGIEIIRDLKKLKTAPFSLAFVTAQQEVDEGDWDECVAAIRQGKKALQEK